MSEDDSRQGRTDARDPGPDDVPPAHADERDPGDAERSRQEENAATSLDEPSDGSGGE